MSGSTEDFYVKGEYFAKNPTWHEERSPWKAQYVMKIMKDNGVQPRSICEVGCGAGEILHQLYLSFPDDVVLDGYDISPQAYELSSKKSTERLKFYAGDFFKESRRSYELLLLLDVFEHVEDYLGFLRSLRGKADYKLFHIPLEISVLRVLMSKPIIRSRSTDGHLHYFTKETALATLEDIGYEIVDHFLTAKSLDLPATSLIYRLGKVPLKIASMLSKDMAARILGGYSLMVLAR